MAESTLLNDISVALDNKQDRVVLFIDLLMKDLWYCSSSNSYFLTAVIYWIRWQIAQLVCNYLCSRTQAVVADGYQCSSWVFINTREQEFYSRNTSIYNFFPPYFQHPWYLGKSMGETSGASCLLTWTCVFPGNRMLILILRVIGTTKHSFMRI